MTRTLHGVQPGAHRAATPKDKSTRRSTVISPAISPLLYHWVTRVYAAAATAAVVFAMTTVVISTPLLLRPERLTQPLANRLVWAQFICWWSAGVILLAAVAVLVTMGLIERYGPTTKCGAEYSTGSTFHYCSLLGGHNGPTVHRSDEGVVWQSQ